MFGHYSAADLPMTVPLTRSRSIRHHETMADTRMFVDNMVASPQNGVTDFVIRRRSDPDQTTSPVIGKIGVYSASKPEIGFLIQRQYWRQGLVSEALTHILPYLFLKRGFNELTADIDPRNEACQGSLERFGFVVTGRRQRTYEIAGESVDSTDLRLTKEEHLVWAEKRQRRPR